MSDKNAIQDLLSDEIKDLYSAERQLTKAIPKMAKGSNDASLKATLTAHLKETHGQVVRLEKAASLLGIKPTGKKCVGMEGCIKEGAEALAEEGNEAVLDLGLIGAGSRVEHYEIAGYMTAISLAQRIGADDVASLLRESLAEEEAADKKLRQIGASIIKSAPAGNAARKPREHRRGKSSRLERLAHDGLGEPDIPHYRQERRGVPQSEHMRIDDLGIC
jgi:ferritin-like metal-binding protein YciE